MPNRFLRPASALLIVASIAVAMPPVLTAQGAAGDTGARVAAPATVKHTVKHGDTLWDIANYYLKDPHKWPQVFNANTDIVKNPHWIYPGQVLTIDAAAVKPELVAKATSDNAVVERIQTSAQAPTVFSDHQSSVHAQLVDATTLPPALTVRLGEYEAAPYVVEERALHTFGRVVGPVAEPALGLTSDAGYRLFDHIYISVPAGLQLSVGDSLLVADNSQSILDVGAVVQPRGVLKIDSLGPRNRALAEIVKQFGVIVNDNAVVPLGRSFEPTTVRPVPGEYSLTAKLLWIQGSPRLPSVQSYVILGAGADRGVQMGDQFTLLNSVSSSDGTRLPVTSTATVTVVRVSPTTSSAIVVRQSQPEIRPGMATRLAAKMP